MGWSVTITGDIHIDGDEGTIYLPSEVFDYINKHQFSIICVKETPTQLETVSISPHYRHDITFRDKK